MISKLEEIIIPIYSASVQLNVKYCVYLWAPHFKKALEKLEQSQKTATRINRKLEIVIWRNTEGTEYFITLRKALFDTEKST